MADSSPMVIEPLYSDSLFDLYNSEALNQAPDFLADSLDDNFYSAAINPNDVVHQQTYETVITEPSTNTELQVEDQLEDYLADPIDDNFFGDFQAADFPADLFDDQDVSDIFQQHCEPAIAVPCMTSLVDYLTQLQVQKQSADFLAGSLYDDDFFGAALVPNNGVRQQNYELAIAAPSANGHILPQSHNQAADIPSGGLNSIYNSYTRLQSHNQAADDHSSRALDPNYGTFQRCYELASDAPSGNNIVDGQTRPEAQNQAADDQFSVALNHNYGTFQRYYELASAAPSGKNMVDGQTRTQAQNQAANDLFSGALNYGTLQRYYELASTAPSGNNMVDGQTRTQVHNQAANDLFSGAVVPNYGTFQRYYELASAAPSGNNIVDGQTQTQAQNQAADDQFSGALNTNYGTFQQYNELAIPTPSKDGLFWQNQAADYPNSLNPYNGVRRQSYELSIPRLRISTYLVDRMPENLRDAIRGNYDEARTCNCKTSECLKLYCGCYSTGMICGKSCKCKGCHNNTAFEEKANKARANDLDDNLLAFVPKSLRSVASTVVTNGNHVTVDIQRKKNGCSCKKSKCQKRYCDCCQAGIGCSSDCECVGCENKFGQKVIDTLLPKKPKRKRKSSKNAFSLPSSSNETQARTTESPEEQLSCNDTAEKCLAQSQ